MDQLKAIIIDDMRLIRTELKHLLSEYPDIKVVGEAANADTAVQLVFTLKPDVVFLDIYMPGQSGFEFLDNVKRDFNVIFISSFYNKGILNNLHFFYLNVKLISIPFLYLMYIQLEKFQYFFKISVN